jgi:hypothetical protein
MFDGPNATVRRQTLGSILHLADQLSHIEVDINLEQFRGCCYSGALPNSSPWNLPEVFEPTRKHWATYQRNELLSLAVQGLFYVVLHAYEESGERFHSVDSLVKWFLSGPEVAQLTDFSPLDRSVSEVTGNANNWLAPLEEWTSEHHEMSLAGKIATLSKSSTDGVAKRSEILLSSLKILIALQCRPETEEGYGPFVAQFPANYLNAYPINLNTFNRHCTLTWPDLTILDWVSWLISTWGVNTHLLVALRKLRGQSQSTFRIRPSDTGLEVIAVPNPVFTSPRFNQALRILKDIGALEKNGDLWSVSAIGRPFMGGTNV